MLNYTLTINNTDLTSYVKFDSYATSMSTVYSSPVVTMDGVTHVRKIRSKSTVSFELNPQDAATTKTIAETLLTQPCSVYYFNLQTQTYETANVMMDDQSAEYLALCEAKGLNWNQMSPIELTEL